MFDINFDSYNYLLFKIDAIKNLSYEEFFKYFVIDVLNNKYLEDKIIKNSNIKQICIANPKVRRESVVVFLFIIMTSIMHWCI